MPSQRVADAAHPAPYLTHAVNHHGQVTLVPPDNAGRVRHAKPRKNKNRQGTERNVRSEEEMRFYTGPKPFRPLVTHRGGRRPGRPGRQDRTRDDGNGDAYPDYPPPSFLEAISTPPSSVCPSTAALVTMSQPIIPQIPTSDVIPSSSPLTTFPSSPCSQPPLSSRNSDVDSDDSLEIIEMGHLDDDLPSGARLEEGVRKDWISRRGVEFPAPPEGQPRGRTKSRVTLDSDSEYIPGNSSEQTTLKKRHMSLSPLRTLFPYRPMNIQDRALSAHPSVHSSPYSSRSPFPFLSTTSLKASMSTSSFLKLPLTPSAPIRGENFMTRTLSSFKGKERSRSESLEAWEVVEPEPSLAIKPSPKVEPSTPRLKSSPTRSHSFTYGTSPIDSNHPVEIASVTPAQADNAHNKAAIHPLSLRDRKVPPVPVINRPTRRPAPPPPAPPASLTTASGPPANPGPVLTSVRTRMTKQPPPPPKKKPQAIGSSPLGADSWKAEDEQDAESFILQRALITPLPVSPTDDQHFEYEAPSTTPVIRDIVPTHPILSPASSPSRPDNQSTNTCLPFTGSSEFWGPDGTPYPPESTYNGSQAIPSVHAHLPESSQLNSRHHYPGRPLPRPPASPRNLVDSTYASYENSVDSSNQIDMHCPEGLLIDLDDTSLMGHSGTSTPRTDDGRYRPYIHSSASASSTEFLGSTTDTILSSHYNASVLPTPTSTVPPSQQPSSPLQYSELTDLDVLMSRLNEAHNGSDYDALLLLSDFIGPASPIRSAAGTSHPLPSSNGAAIANSADNVALVGNVKLERRRTTNDGRIKLKLTLLNSPVDKCGICLTQFKNDDLGKIGSSCRHAFHEKCIARWLVRSKTCPMCRVPFVNRL